MRPAARPTDRRRERGATLVEFALVLPLLMAFFLGIVTAGIAYSRHISMNNGARESARYGAVLPVNGDLDTWLHTVADVAIESTSGDMDATVGGQRVCVAYVFPDGTTSEDSTKRLVEDAGSRTLTSGSTCFTDSRPSSERRVQVTLERTSRFETVFFAGDLQLSAENVARFERSAG